MAVAPLVSAGRISCRQTVSVTLVDTWPTSWLTSSSGTCAVGPAEHQVVILPRLARLESVGRLLPVMRLERRRYLLGQLEDTT